MRSLGTFSPQSLALLAAALAVVALAAGFMLMQRPPPPDGPNAVGRTELALTGADGQAIPVTLWYPISGRRGGAAVADAPLAAPAGAPLILSAPGWHGTRVQSRTQLENLASHGFVVAACDDLASNAATDPDRGASFDFSSDAATQLSIERAGRHVERQAALLGDILRALATREAGQFAGRIDLERVGVLGYSAGGAAGVQFASMDARVVAVFNLDGGLFGPAADEPGRAAYFLVSSREAFLPAADLTSPNPATRNNAIVTARDNARQAQRTNRPGSYWAAIDRADHADLSDRLFTLTRRTVLRPPFERRGIGAALRAYQAAFFRSALLGEQAPLLSGPPYNQYVRWVTATSEAPGAASAQR